MSKNESIILPTFAFKMASCSSLSPPCSSPLGPSTQDFIAALASHVDESKPDPLARRQIENLVLQWEPSSSTQQAESSSDPTKEIQEVCGTLTLFGEYTSISISSNCKWRWNSIGEQGSGCAHAALSFRLVAAARFIPQSKHNRLEKERLQRTKDAEKTDDNNSSKSPKIDRKEQRAQTKIRSGMIDRLKNDFYIKRLLDLDGGSSTVSGGKCDNEQVELQHRICEAEIKESFNADGTVKELEERVDASEDALEGIRRAVLSHLDTNTSLLDLLLAFPYLINAQSATRKDGKGNDITLQLGHRAILRLLEDACIAACEKEGEDELLDELQICENDRGEGDTGTVAVWKVKG